LLRKKTEKTLRPSPKKSASRQGKRSPAIVAGSLTPGLRSTEEQGSL